MASQGLFDALAGAAGANINRPQLNAQVAQSQALNGLRSAQTEEALLKAQESTEEAAARGKLEEAIGTLFPGEPSKAHAATIMTLSGFGGKAKDALAAFNEAQTNNANTILGDHNKLGSPEQTAAMQVRTGKLAPLENVPNNFAVAPGAPQPNIQQSPQGAAQTANTLAEAHLHGTQGAIDPNAVDFGGYMLYKTGKMPAMGMGGGPARSAIIARAAQLSQQEASGQPVSNPGFDTAISNGQDFTASQRALSGFAGGSLGNSVRSVNNGVGHLRLMDNLFTALENGDVQGVNKLGNLWKQRFGSPAPTSVQAAAEAMGPELMKIMTNNSGAGTGPEREAFAHIVGNLGNAPEQTHQAINTLRDLFSRQAADFALQYHGATGRNDFATRYLQPDVMQDLHLGPNPSVSNPTPTAGATPSGPSLGSQPPAPIASAAPTKPTPIKSDADYNQLPSGAHFVGPDGHERVKP